VFDKLLSLIDRGAMVDILTVIECSSKDDRMIGRMIIVDVDGRVEGPFDDDIILQIQDIMREIVWVKPLTFSVQDQFGETYRLFWDRTTKRPHALVFGGGHISQPLVHMLSMLDFHVTVVDDRPEFSNPERFPLAEAVICESFSKVFQQLTIDKDTAIIIVTRGHRYDLDCLHATIDSDARYLGMIGSKKRVREMINLLREEGTSEENLRRLRAPIGLDINAETPVEIALSIAAEVVSNFRGGSNLPLSGMKEGV